MNLLSWNILAPYWVRSEWYPTLFHHASQHNDRFKKISQKIKSLNFDVVLIQEAQEDVIPLLKETLNDDYYFHAAWNDPKIQSVRHGLLTLIRKQWYFAPNTTVHHDILDPELGEAIQIIHISDENQNIVNLHLNYDAPLFQGKLVLPKCRDMLNQSESPTILAGDLNSKLETVRQFGWNEYQDVFGNNSITIPTYYPDPEFGLTNAAIDHIFYDNQKLKLLQYGKAWSTLNGTLHQALKELGSDHIYIWAKFELS